MARSLFKVPHSSKGRGSNFLHSSQIEKKMMERLFILVNLVVNCPFLKKKEVAMILALTNQLPKYCSMTNHVKTCSSLMKAIEVAATSWMLGKYS